MANHRPQGRSLNVKEKKMVSTKSSKKASKTSGQKASKAKSKYDFSIIGVDASNPSWNGSPLTLNPNDNANMPQAPNGSLVLAYQNKATINTMGQLAITSGGGAPTFLNAQSLLNQPNVLTQNFGGSTTNNLSVTNTSMTGSNNPIWVAAYGPGIPNAPTPAALPATATPVPLGPGATAQGTALPRYMQLIMQATSGSLTIFALVGGPMDSSGNNAYVISVNDSFNGNTGPGTGKTPPAGYYATSTSNAYIYSFNWGSSNIYIANMSPATSATASVVLRAL
jgi:hypothetical protein